MIIQSAHAVRVDLMNEQQKVLVVIVNRIGTVGDERAKAADIAEVGAKGLINDGRKAPGLTIDQLQHPVGMK